MYNVIFSPRFDKSYSKIIKGNSKLHTQLKKTLRILSTDPTHPSLRLHKLTLRERYSISVDMSVRIICSFEKNEIHLLDIGKHEDVY